MSALRGVSTPRITIDSQRALEWDARARREEAETQEFLRLEAELLIGGELRAPLPDQLPNGVLSTPLSKLSASVEYSPGAYSAAAHSDPISISNGPASHRSARASNPLAHSMPASRIPLPSTPPGSPMTSRPDSLTNSGRRSAGTAMFNPRSGPSPSPLTRLSNGPSSNHIPSGRTLLHTPPRHMHHHHHDANDTGNGVSLTSMSLPSPPSAFATQQHSKSQTHPRSPHRTRVSAFSPPPQSNLISPLRPASAHTHQRQQLQHSQRASSQPTVAPAPPVMPSASHSVPPSLSQPQAAVPPSTSSLSLEEQQQLQFSNKLQELNEQIAQFRKDSDDARRAAETHKREVLALHADQAAWSRARADQQSAFMLRMQEETEKLKKEKRLLKQYRRQGGERDKARVEQLQLQLRAQQQDIAAKEERWKSVTERLKSGADSMSRAIGQLQRQIHALEQERQEAWNSQRAAEDAAKQITDLMARGAALDARDAALEQQRRVLQQQLQQLVHQGGAPGVGSARASPVPLASGPNSSRASPVPPHGSAPGASSASPPPTTPTLASSSTPLRSARGADVTLTRPPASAAPGSARPRDDRLRHSDDSVDAHQLPPPHTPADAAHNAPSRAPPTTTATATATTTESRSTPRRHGSPVVRSGPLSSRGAMPSGQMPRSGTSSTPQQPQPPAAKTSGARVPLSARASPAAPPITLGSRYTSPTLPARPASAGASRVRTPPSSRPGSRLPLSAVPTSALATTTDHQPQVTSQAPARMPLRPASAPPVQPPSSFSPVPPLYVPREDETPISVNVLHEGKTEKIFANGRRLITFPDSKKEVWPDGRVIVCFSNGDVRQQIPDGREIY